MSSTRTNISITVDIELLKTAKENNLVLSSCMDAGIVCSLQNHISTIETRGQNIVKLQNALRERQEVPIVPQSNQTESP